MARNVTYKGVGFNLDWALAKGEDGFVLAMVENVNLFPRIIPLEDREQAFREAFRAITGLPAPPPPKSAEPVQEHEPDSDHHEHN